MTITIEEKRRHHTEYMRNWIKNNPEKREMNRLAQARWYKLNHVKQISLTKKWRKSNPEKQSEINKRYRHKNHIKCLAHQTTYRHLHHWYNCMVCKSDKDLHEHHVDYSKRELTITLCRKCHNDLHNGKLLLGDIK
jgi:sugar diacid utilization regulator